MLLESHHCHLMQQSTILSMLSGKRIQQHTKRAVRASNFHYIDDLEQQEGIFDERIEVKNNWSIENGKNYGENGNNS
jgi:pimeloyl-CoA synthetase